jgi:hypothetical protein
MYLSPERYVVLVSLRSLDLSKDLKTPKDDPHVLLLYSITMTGEKTDKGHWVLEIFCWLAGGLFFRG